MVENSGRRRLDGAAPPRPVGGGIGPRRLLPVPANDNRVPARVRVRRVLIIAAAVAALAWAITGLMSAGL